MLNRMRTTGPLQIQTTRLRNRLPEFPNPGTRNNQQRTKFSIVFFVFGFFRLFYKSLHNFQDYSYTGGGYHTGNLLPITPGKWLPKTT